MVEAYLPYSQALYDLANDRNKIEEYEIDMKELAGIWSENADFVKALAHPKVTRVQKRQWLTELFSGKVDDIVYRYLCILTEHNVIAHIPEIYEGYVSIWRQAKNIEVVKVTSASSLSEKQQADLKAMLEKKMNKKVELDIKEDPSLIAGLRVQTGQFILDNTALSRLDTMKEKLKG